MPCAESKGAGARTAAGGGVPAGAQDRVSPFSPLPAFLLLIALWEELKEASSTGGLGSPAAGSPASGSSAQGWAEAER